MGRGGKREGGGGGRRGRGKEGEGTGGGREEGALTLSQVDVGYGAVNVVSDGVPCVDHESVHKLHRLGSLSPQFS